MSIEHKNIAVYGSAVMPDNDTVTEIGGAISLTKKCTWKRLTASPEDALDAVSSSAGDITQNITVTVRRPSGAIEDDVISLNGQTLVNGTLTANRIMKAVKSATCAGTVAVISQTREELNMALDGGGTDYMILPFGASAVDNYYQGMVFYSKTGTGANQLGMCVAYDGTTKYAYFKTFGTAFDGTETVDIAEGVLFDKSPNEILECRRICYAAAAEPSSGSDRIYVEKVFFKNEHATLALTNCYLSEDQTVGVYADVDFALETTKDGTGTNGAGNNRQVAPTSGVTAFDSADKLVNTGNLGPGEAIGCWFKLNLTKGKAAQNSEILMIVKGDTI